MPSQALASAKEGVESRRRAPTAYQATVKACSRPRTRAAVLLGAAKAEVAGKSAALKSVSVRLRPRAPSMTRVGAGSGIGQRAAHGAPGVRAAVTVQRAEPQQVDRGQQNRRTAPREQRPRQGETELAGRGYPEPGRHQPAAEGGRRT